MSSIAVLPDLVVDQIAAGEVLEGPASAVKELIENSLDAGAKSIRVEIEAGGLQKIQIEDDGCGMNGADVLLCLKRHATSKIRTAEDLQKLITMGFRGEALAALAAVSKLELKTSDGKESSKLAATGGKAERIEVCARNRGTTIEARSLFFNTPARLKFQKSTAASAAAVLKTVQTISLAHPEVAFRLSSNGKLTFDVRPESWKARAETVLGSFTHEVERKYEGLLMRALLGRPEEAKATRSGQVVFINQRPIFSPLISRAVKEGFGTRMEEKLFPVFLLFLEIPPEAVDVNVHPQKKEVRFRDESKVYAQVRDAIASAFSEGERSPPPVPWEFTPAPTGPFILREEAVAEVEVPLPLPMRGQPFVLLSDFLLVQEGGGWLLADVRGMEARILFEALESPNTPIQPLIWPLEMEVGESAEEFCEWLKGAKIEAHPVAPRKVAIDALPAGLEPSQVATFIREFQQGKKERKFAAVLTRTCRSLSRRYSFEEACLLWRKLQNCKDTTYDPLGRPLVVSLTEQTLKELFQ
ncbi:MAG: DNA mismatch repair endonuclease MutL [Verrucomicrobiota bacterium]|nr:DNA mismatch repair endonuclease MutL [Verrucomicrobiota bacterium]